jgi:hypothetical protein
MRHSKREEVSEWVSESKIKSRLGRMIHLFIAAMRRMRFIPCRFGIRVRFMFMRVIGF